MSMFSLIPSIIFAAIGILIIAFTIKVFLSALVGNPWTWFERQKLIRKERILLEGDGHFKSDNQALALSCWKAAFFLERVKYQPSLIDSVHTLNINVLARLVSISDKRSAHIINLPVVEELFAERTELMQAYFDTKSTIRKLRLKRKEPKSSPDWALKEFSKKQHELRQKIEHNKGRLESELKKLFDALTRLSKEQEITYH